MTPELQLIETAPKDGTPILGWDGEVWMTLSWSTLTSGARPRP